MSDQETHDNEVNALWQARDAERVEQTQWDEFESFPYGAGDDSALAGRLQESGLLYAANLALHGAGMALGIERHEGEGEHADKRPALFLAATADPEGVTFDELGHRESIDKMSDDLLGRLVFRLGEAHARLRAELERRQA